MENDKQTALAKAMDAFGSMDAVKMAVHSGESVSRKAAVKTLSDADSIYGVCGFGPLGARRFVKATSYGAVLATLDGKESDIRFQKGYICRKINACNGTWLYLGGESVDMFVLYHVA